MGEFIHTVAAERLFLYLFLLCIKRGIKEILRVDGRFLVFAEITNLRGVGLSFVVTSLFTFTISSF